ncbi:MAG: DEAD/DEAH box helicase [Spirochaetia bacterium]|nr:DEAD/DEAH box helicase [Spirochaetia bacterium]
MNRIQNLISQIKQQRFYNNQITDIITIPPVPPIYAEPDDNLKTLRSWDPSIERLYIHQAEACRLVQEGRNVIITTPTASGKTLAFNLPILQDITQTPGTRALYIYPAKALANDQLKVLETIKERSGLKFEAGIYDGDTESHLKKHLRDEADIIITNPYELHQILPFHPKWNKFYKGLKYVVIDEAHRYKGVFGSNIAMLMRRLKRVLAIYGVNPQFIASTASIANPLEFITKLTGEQFESVDKNGAPSAEKYLVLWDSSFNPQKSVHTQTKDLLLFCAKSGFQTLSFTSSRRMAELIRMWANAEDRSTDILCYRAGYDPATRREIERKLKEKEVLGVVSTNALELGIDIGQLDVIILSGYPGTISSFWQQAGRAGRKNNDSAVVYLPHEDALQKYLLHNPSILTSKTFENAIISTENPNIIMGHVLCALSEAPSKSKKIFDDIDASPFVDAMAGHGLVTETPRGYIYSGARRPQDTVPLESMGSGTVKIKINGRILEEVEMSRACNECYKGAVYIHNGETYVIKELNLESGEAVAAKEDVDHYTEPMKDEDVEILKVKKTRDCTGYRLCFGDVKVTEFFKAYRTKKAGKVISCDDLMMPPLKFNTEAVWMEFDYKIVSLIKSAGLDFDGSIHAAEHALIALSPLFAMCDRNDIGGRSYPAYGDDGNPCIFIYDGYDGGIGISEKLFEVFGSLASNTMEMVTNCGCEEGCPYCVYSPKCGNGNNPIDKAGSLIILNYLI